MSNETNACAFVKDKVSLTEFIERHEEVKSGRAAHSVAHESVSKNALHIDESNGRFFCHSCGAKGSVIDYEISRIGGDPKNEEDVMRAVKSIAEQENLTLPEGGKPLTPEDKERIEKRREEKASVQGLLNASRDFYVSKLTPSRRESLTERGVKTKTITALQIGYAPYQQGEKTALVKHLSPLAHGDESLLLKTGLVKRNEKGNLVDFYWDRYVIPYHNERGEMVYSCGRAAGNAKPWKDEEGNEVTPHKFLKHITDAEKGVDTDVVQHLLWNSAEVEKATSNNKRQKPILITEGAVDGILAWQELREDYDILCTGTTTLNETDRFLLVGILERRWRGKVIFCHDAEDSGAGAEGALQSARKLERAMEIRHTLSATRDLARKEAKKAKAEKRDPQPLSPAEVAEEAKRRMPDIRIATLPKPPELDKVDLADYVTNGWMRDLRYWIRAAMTLYRYEAWLADNPTRFFDKRGRATGDGTFRAKYLADEMRLERYYLFAGDTLYHYEQGVFQDAEVQKDALGVMKHKLDERWKDSCGQETLKALAIDTVEEANAVNPNTSINFQNGVLEIPSTAEGAAAAVTFSTLHSPYNLSTIQFNASWIEWGGWKDGQPPTPARFDEFLREIVDEEDVLTIYEMIGYTMHSSADLHKAFILEGGGKNGKSTLLRIIQTLLGEGNCEAIPLQDLDDNQWARADLYQKAANIVPDLPATTLKKSDIFKSVVSGDRIRGEQKYKNAFHFNPTTTMIVSLNEMPRTYDKTDGFYRRLLILNFPNTFEEGGESTRLQSELVAECTTPDELAAIATKAFWCYLAARKRGAFTESETSKAKKAAYQEEGEPMLVFIEQALDITGDASDVITMKRVHDLYKAWMETEHENRTDVLGKQQFGKKFLELHESDGVDKVRRKEGRSYCGVRKRADFVIERTDAEKPDEGIRASRTEDDIPL